jgi:hypothetical protein
VKRGMGLVVVIGMTGACGAESWSFDHHAGTGDADGPAFDAQADDADALPAPAQDAALDGNSLRETGLAPESGPVVEAAPGCSADQPCPSSAPLCSPSGVCTRCAADADCPGDAGAPVCDVSTGACVECTSNSGCATSGALPNCNTTTNRCVQCLTNPDCGFESVCQLATHTCTKMF